jgi:hypothetical protein
VGLRDRINLTSNPIAASILVAAVWVGLSSLFGAVGIIDLVVAVVLVFAGVTRQRAKKAKLEQGDDKRGIYGPPS